MNPLDAVARYGSQSQAADNLGIGRTKFREMYKLAAFQQSGGKLPPSVETIKKPSHPDEFGYTEQGYTQWMAEHNGPDWQQKDRPEDRPIKPRISIRADMPSTRVLAIGDTHDSPKLPDKARFRWVARHAAKTRPDRIVHIGDFGDFASCSMHEPLGSIGYAHKPSFRQDIESLEEALTAIYREIGSAIPFDLVEGNHEHRVARWEEAHPAVEGGFYQQLQDLWARYGIKPYKYGDWLFIDGVGFTHVPQNIMGKAYGGKASENAIANDALFSVVFGHTHRSGFKRAPKIGPAQSIEVLNLGSAMPDGYVAKYAGTATTGWSYGVYDIEICAGHITAHNFIPMSKLAALYGD